MIARGKFRDDAAIVLMHGHLRVQGMREQGAAGIGAEERDTRFVAGGFDSENQHRRILLQSPSAPPQYGSAAAPRTTKLRSDG